MNVLMYGWEYPPHISGGLGVACHALVQALLRKNVNINLVLPYELSGHSIIEGRLRIIGWDDPRAPNETMIPQSSVYKIDSLLHPYLTPSEYQKIINPINPLHIYKKSGQTQTLAPQLQNFNVQNQGSDLCSNHYGNNLFDEVLRYAQIAGSLAKDIAHDIIHAHDWMTILAGIKAQNLSKKKLIFHVHALEIDRSGVENVNRQIFDIEKYGMGQADRVVAVSNYTKNIIIKHYGISAAKIVVVHNGIDPTYVNQFVKNHEKRSHKTVLFLGRVTHQKGPSQFVEIANKILEKRRDVDFVIAGTGNLLVEIIEKVATLRIGKHVHFTGFLDCETVKRMFCQTDVYVMPSISEPFGLSC
jgi:glycogen synthase